MTEQRKKQHYIPQFYLREFAIASKQSQIYCFDKKTSKVFLAATNKVGSENYFYDVDGRQHIEAAFGELEGKFSLAYKSLLNLKDIQKLNLDDRLGLAVFIAIQHLRTRSMRDVVKETANFVLQNENNSLENQNKMVIQLLETIAKEEALAKRFQYTMMLKGLPGFIESIFQMKWILVVNATSFPFCCSDNPLTYSNNLKFDKYDGLGFERTGSQLHFPLNPHLSLNIVDPRFFSEYPRFINVDDEDKILFNNRLQVENAQRYIFSSNNDFSFAEKVLKDNPKLREPNKYLFEDIDGKISLDKFL